MRVRVRVEKKDPSRKYVLWWPVILQREHCRDCLPVRTEVGATADCSDVGAMRDGAEAGAGKERATILTTALRSSAEPFHFVSLTKSSVVQILPARAQSTTRSMTPFGRNKDDPMSDRAIDPKSSHIRRWRNSQSARRRPRSRSVMSYSFTTFPERRGCVCLIAEGAGGMDSKRWGAHNEQAPHSTVSGMRHRVQPPGVFVSHSRWSDSEV